MKTMQVEFKVQGFHMTVPAFDVTQKIPDPINPDQALHFTFEEAANPSASEATKLVVTDAFYIHAHLLNQMRDWAKRSFVVNSWYRTPSFNKSVGGIDTSNHVKGTASDIAYPSVTTEAQFNEVAGAWRALCEANKTVGEAIWYKKSKFIHFGSQIDYQKTFYKAVKNE